jgi:hypothetical protein
MIGNIWSRIIEWFSDFNQRNALIKAFNASARETFICGIVPTLLKASLSRGDRAYRHQHSDWLYSGFRIQAFAGRQLSKDELFGIGAVVLSNDSLVRQLIVLGWDTLEVYGDGARQGLRWQLKDFMALAEHY